MCHVDYDYFEIDAQMGPIIITPLLKSLCQNWIYCIEIDLTFNLSSEPLPLGAAADIHSEAVYFM